jgi:hypothetical protein
VASFRRPLPPRQRGNIKRFSSAPALASALEKGTLQKVGIGPGGSRPRAGIASPSPGRDPSLIVRLFRKSDEKLALEATAQAEIERLKTLSIEELAVILLPGLGPEAAGPGRHLRPQQLCEYLLRDFPGLGQTRPLQLMAAVRRALDRLEDAGLVSSMAYALSPVWRITSLGTSVLADGTAGAHLITPA